jgi:hypothetical protein
MSNFNVLKDKDIGKWNIQKEGGTRSSGSENTQQEAEQRARELSANSGGGEVRIEYLLQRKLDCFNVVLCLKTLYLGQLDRFIKGVSPSYNVFVSR